MWRYSTRLLVFIDVKILSTYHNMSIERRRNILWRTIVYYSYSHCNIDNHIHNMVEEIRVSIIINNKSFYRGHVHSMRF